MKILSLVVTLVLSGSMAVQAQGWAVFANGGNVYRVEAGGSPEEIYSGNVNHATWSADGLRVFFIKTNGEIWSMYNNGTSAKKIADGSTTSYCPIGPYRPDPDYVLYVENDKFYRIHADSGQTTQIHDEPRNYVGETAIDESGTRMAGRGTNSNLYTIPVGGTSSEYSVDCSASISPDGNYVTANMVGHTQLRIHNWDGTVYKTLNAPNGAEWDNQKFVVNSNNWVVYKHDNESAIGIVRVTDNQNTRVCNMGSDYPDFFLGNIPDVPDDNQAPSASIDSPTHGAGYQPGDLLFYSGHADDPEDGSLTGSSLAWELDRTGDGLGPVHTGSGTSGSYTFPADITENTEYFLRLTAQDSGGLSDTDQISVWVNPQATNSAPVISSVSVDPNPVSQGVEVTFLCSASDPDNDPLSFSWNFGDGESANGNPATHAYIVPDDYTASVEVNDGQGHAVSAQEVVSVVNPDSCVLEAEDMNLDGYEIEGDYIATMDTGTAFDTVHCPTNTYRVTVVIIKENDGQPTLEVYLDEVLVGTIHYALGASSRDPESIDLGVYPITQGDPIRLEGALHEGAAARVDKIIFQVDELPPEDGGVDAGTDAGADPGQDAGTDAGEDDGSDAGGDTGVDAGEDAGIDAGQDASTTEDGDPGSDPGADTAAGDQDPGGDTEVSGGCSCATGSPARPLLPVLLVLGLLLGSRRRSRP